VGGVLEEHTPSTFFPEECGSVFLQTQIPTYQTTYIWSNFVVMNVGQEDEELSYNLLCHFLLLNK
jgi:hypothetical protein